MPGIDAECVCSIDPSSREARRWHFWATTLFTIPVVDKLIQCTSGKYPL
jgi:hypothetical protein